MIVVDLVLLLLFSVTRFNFFPTAIPAVVVIFSAVLLLGEKFTNTYTNSMLRSTWCALRVTAVSHVRFANYFFHSALDGTMTVIF
jgi:hypothetical protein